MAGVDIEVSYSQLAVFDSRLESPFNNWADVHVRQGFAWRPGSVSFGTLQDGGTLRLEVVSGQALEESVSAARRIIAVPFAVPHHGEVEIASIASGISLKLSPGDYEVIFEHGVDERRGMWANLYFRQADGQVAARIVRADPELDPPSPLAMHAEPAT